MGKIAVLFVFTFYISVFTHFRYDVAEAQTIRDVMSAEIFPGLAQKISIDIRDMDVVSFLKFLAIEGNLNIVTTPAVTGRVNLIISDVTIDNVLEIVLSMNNFAFQVKGNVLKVMTNEEYKTAYGVDFYENRTTYVCQLKYASPANVGMMLGNVKSAIGKVVYDDSTGTLILVDTHEKVEEMKKIIEKQELPTVTRVLPTVTETFELKYARIDDVKSEITEALTADIGSMRTDTRTNTMIITDLPHNMKNIVELIGSFDRKTRKVFIEAKIVEVTLSDTFKWGIDWDTVLRMTISSAGQFSKYAIMPEIALPLDLAENFGKVTVNTVQGETVNAVLEMLSTVTETRILSNPHLTVVEGKEAKIEVIEKQPYEEETTTTASGGTTTTSKTYQWVDVGVLLNVTPHINEDGFITMSIRPEVSSISTWYGGAAQTAGAVPVVKSANAETTIIVKDGVTILIAGLIKEQKTSTINKIPFLGDLPYLGSAFRNVSDDIRRTETIVFLTPVIVGGDKSFLTKRNQPKQIKGQKGSSANDS